MRFMPFFIFIDNTGKIFIFKRTCNPHYYFLRILFLNITRLFLDFLIFLR